MHDFSFGWWHGADWVIRGVFMALIGLSLLSWSIIIFKTWQLSRGLSKARRHRRQLTPTPDAPPLAYDPRREQLLREWRTSLEGGLTWLATIGATTPFLGLLGTVWGIMHALRQLGSNNAVSLDLVAGPVAEALVATAVGLFVAIPAVVAYNLLIRQLRRLMVVLEGNLLLQGSHPGGDHGLV